MTFEFLDEILGFYPDLRVLERNSQPYSLLLYQHEGNLSATNTRVGNETTSKNATFQLASFFGLAKEKNVDLALTPEYCCPWSVIEDIVKDRNKWLLERKLWVVGTESITKEQLRTFYADFNTGNCFIHFDQSLLNDNKAFFDPLVYFFISNHESNFRLNLFIQFKSQHMSAWSGDGVEKNNLIRGKKLFIVRNSRTSIHFVSFICSEAMNVPLKLTPELQDDIDWVDRPYLIFNPQLNGDPAHYQFTAFRRFIMKFNHKEIIELNWSMNSTFSGTKVILGGSSRSGFIINSNDINQTDYNKIRRNHSKGLYYFYYGMNRHAFLCNSYLNAFLINASAVDIQDVVAQQSRRDGPALIETFYFDENNDLIIPPVPASDKLLSYLNGVTCKNLFLINPENCILEKERLVCISSGEIYKGSSTWYQVDKLHSVSLDANTEINLRITFAEDTIQQSIDQRKKYVRAIIELDNILANRKDLFPPSIESLKSKKLYIGYSQKVNNDRNKLIILDKYRYNTTTDEDEIIKATVCYLDQPDDAEVNSKFDILQELFDLGNSSRERVVIFFKRGNEYDKKSDPNAGKFTIISDYPGPSILNANS
ncbi:MAG: hypothetical protein KGM16_13650 [Bacteroidota bacterium]|nr:hypothetical protein [Bacteroidota bacterium]